MSVTQTGHPGPMMTESRLGSAERRPNLAIDCSWLPQTCMTETRSRPISSSARALTGSRNLSSATSSRASVSATGERHRCARGLDLAPHVVCHHVPAGLTQQDLVEGERLLDVTRGDLPDREAHVVEDVVSRPHGLVDHVEPGFAPDAEEVDQRHLALDRDDFAGHSEAHASTSLKDAGGDRG